MSYTPGRWFLALVAVFCVSGVSRAQKDEMVVPLKNWTVPPLGAHPAVFARSLTPSGIPPPYLFRWTRVVFTIRVSG
jgi:hypothetical protein